MWNKKICAVLTIETDQGGIIKTTMGDKLSEIFTKALCAKAFHVNAKKPIETK